MDNADELRTKIETAALRLGATRAAIFKWRSRGMPSDWKLKLLGDGETTFSTGDFDSAFPGKAKNKSPFPEAAQ